MTHKQFCKEFLKEFKKYQKVDMPAYKHSRETHMMMFLSWLHFHTERHDEFWREG